jgi:two-component system, OmpR family, phosphate regulon response regulator PhoB
MGHAVLLVHAEPAVRQAARKALESAGHSICDVTDLAGAWRGANLPRPDLVLLPWHGACPIRDSIADLRDDEFTRQCRLMIWAAQTEMHEAINALELGADDCVALPFHGTELVARVNACLRRPAAKIRQDELRGGPLFLDKAVHSLTVNERRLDLAPAEFRLLAFFLENQDRVFGRDELLRRAWSKNITAGHRTVDVHVRRLRRLFEPFGCDDLIQTVHGFGYRFSAPPHKFPSAAASSEIARQ